MAINMYLSKLQEITVSPGRPGVLQSIGSQSWHDRASEQQEKQEETIAHSGDMYAGGGYLGELVLPC